MAILDLINYAAGQDSMQDVFDKANAIIDRYNERIIEHGIKSVAIGPWDMDTNSQVTFTIGVHYDKLRAIAGVMIQNDSGSEKYVDGVTNSSGTQGDNVELWVEMVTPADINNPTFILRRRTGGRFDNTSFNDAVSNRGYITIIYDES